MVQESTNASSSIKKTRNASRRLKFYLFLFLFLSLVGGILAVCIKYYSFLFARNVQGEIIGVERVNQAETIIAGGRPIPASQLYSFAVAIRDIKTGEIVTASSEDRQWAVAGKGQCAEAKYFPYEPWKLDRAGTYFGARLLKLYDCKK